MQSQNCWNNLIYQGPSLCLSENIRMAIKLLFTQSLNDFKVVLIQSFRYEATLWQCEGDDWKEAWSVSPNMLEIFNPLHPHGNSTEHIYLFQSQNMNAPFLKVASQMLSLYLLPLPPKVEEGYVFTPNLSDFLELEF